MAVQTRGPTADGDVLVDIRAQPGALRAVAGFLLERHFTPDPSPDGIVHRFRLASSEADAVIDVLVPDNVGVRADLTTDPPGLTLQVPAGTQALRRTELVNVLAEGRLGTVPRPNLVGAVLVKVAALSLPGDARRHETDIAFLLACMPNPLEAGKELTSREVAPQQLRPE